VKCTRYETPHYAPFAFEVVRVEPITPYKYGYVLSCPVQHNRCFKVVAFRAVTPYGRISTMKMEAARSSEILVSNHITAWCQNPEDSD
jgi:hypothetical protein